MNAPTIKGPILPERDLRCIFEAIFVGEDLVAGIAASLGEGTDDCVDIWTVI